MIFVVLILFFVLFIYCFKVLVVKSLKTQTFNRTINAIWNKRIFFLVWLKQVIGPLVENGAGFFVLDLINISPLQGFFFSFMVFYQYVVPTGLKRIPHGSHVGNT